MVKNWADHCSSDEESIGGDDAAVAEQFDEHLQITSSPTPADGHGHGHGHDETIYDDSNPDINKGTTATTSHTIPQQQQQQRKKTYDYPSQPPFTAFVGNLSYNIRTNEDFVKAMDEECRRRFLLLSSSSPPGQEGEENEVKFLGGRIAFSRDGGNHRGFGYLEVETLDQVRL